MKILFSSFIIHHLYFKIKHSYHEKELYFPNVHDFMLNYF